MTQWCRDSIVVMSWLHSPSMANAGPTNVRLSKVTSKTIESSFIIRSFPELLQLETEFDQNMRHALETQPLTKVARLGRILRVLHNPCCQILALFARRQLGLLASTPVF